ncbi:hypothetical protein GCM10020000_67540 [Streptomyces olivoverticillatus]
MSGALKVPHVRHGLGLTAVSERFEETARGLLSSTADRLGTGAGLPAPDLTLDNCPPTLWSPPADGVRQPMRYIPYNGTGTLPDWAREPSGPPQGVHLPGHPDHRAQRHAAAAQARRGGGRDRGGGAGDRDRGLGPRRAGPGSLLRADRGVPAAEPLPGPLRRGRPPRGAPAPA